MTSKKKPIVETNTGVVALLYVLIVIVVELFYCAVTKPGEVSTGVAIMQGVTVVIRVANVIV